MVAPGPSRSDDLSEADLQFLLEYGTEFASRVAQRYRWRGALHGVLPEGYEPSSIAAEALAQLCAQRTRRSRRCRPSSSPSAARLPSSGALSHPRTASLRLRATTRRPLRRLICRQINRLYHLKENRGTCNEPDLSPETLEDGDQLSPIDFIPGPEPTPAQILLEAEADAEWDKLKAEFISFLGKRRALATLFKFLSAGIRNPGRLARLLGRRSAAVRNLHDQLKRQFWRFKNAKSVRNRLKVSRKSQQYFLEHQHLAFAE